MLRIANGVLLASMLAVGVTVLLEYPLADRLPMAAQIGSHIAILVFAATLELAYVTRLVSLRSLGRPVY